MKRLFFFSILIGFLFVTACSKKEDETKPAQLAPGTHKVKVVESHNASNYTYIKASENNNEFWIAVPAMEVKTGDEITFSQYMEMKDFQSPTTKQTFKSILFVSDASKGSAMPAPMHGMGNTGSMTGGMGAMHAPNTQKEDIKITPLQGGMTIAQIYAKKESLAGKTIKVRGKVVKYNPDIMDRNWIHIQDGTGSQDSYDILVTSAGKASVGQTIVVEGKIAVNKDFGAGYKYPVLIEDATVKAE